MKQTLSIALLLVAVTCLSLSHDHFDWKDYRHDAHFTLKFDYAARNGVAFGSNSFTVSWNGQKILNHYPENYEIQAFSFNVEGHSGENTLSFAGTGTSDGLGATISNVQLLRTTYCGEEDAIVNGAFNEPDVGSGWRIFPNVPGWTATHGIEIGRGGIYNGRWPAGTHITELDTTRNTVITQSVWLDDRHRVSAQDQDN
jgi:hypothetical protein